MAQEQAFRHRPTTKKANKIFKSKHSTKGELKTKTKGRLGGEISKTTNATRIASKADRRNKAKLIQKRKREEIVKSARVFQGLNGAPKVVAVIPLCADVGSSAVVDALYASMELEWDVNDPAILTLERFKQKLHLIPTSRNLHAILDACLAADIILFVLSAEEEVDAFGDLVMTSIKTQGVPSILSCVQHLEPVPPKKQLDVRKSLFSFIDFHFPGQDHKLFSIGAAPEVVNLARAMADLRPKEYAWREKYARVVAEQVEFVPKEGSGEGTLKVTGYVRGMPLSANRLLNVPGCGDFQIKMITSSPLIIREAGMNVDDTVLDKPNEQQQSLVAVNKPDPMAAEQTWPTDEEIHEAEVRVARRNSLHSITGSVHTNTASATSTSSKRRIIRVPKGTSAYQAAWIIESDAEEEDDDEEEGSDNDNDMMDEEYEENVEGGDMLLSLSHSGSSNGRKFDGTEEDEDDDEEYEDLDLDIAESERPDAEDDDEDPKTKSAREDLEFPDEVDTPRTMDARTRFQKYRGLKSFRLSPWDPYESLPVDYERIFQFKDFKKTKNRTLKVALEGPVDVGERVTVWIERVPTSFSSKGAINPSDAFTLFALLPHEQKFSVLHFSLTRTTSPNEEDDLTVKSKDPMIIFTNYRRIVARPIYSTDTRGGSNNVHKFERFLQHGRSSVGTIYGPVTYGPGPVLMFAADQNAGWNESSPPNLIATGSILDPSPTRVIAKRIILTGHPYKIHKKSAVIRYMFYNPIDVAWFKPIQLYTKLGRVGHIKESLGTKGYMKCVFDGGLKQQDTVCMALYKRVFPRWGMEVFKRRDEGERETEGGGFITLD